MKRLLTAAAATAVLAAASGIAVGQTVPTQPVSGPVPTPDSGNGGLFVWAYDAVRNVSLVDYLGLSLNDVLPTSNMTTDGFTLDFGVVSQYSTIFGASSASNIRWGVGAADFQGGISSMSLVSTGPLANSTLFMNAAGLSSANGQMNNFLLSVNGACATTNPCTATSPDAGQYAGQSTWADTWGGGLGWEATATVGTALGFYRVTPGPGARPTTAVVTAYASLAGNYGQWLLDEAGHLTYSVPSVPLPAAVWLLLSGAAGVFTVGRRRRGAASAVAAA